MLSQCRAPMTSGSSSSAIWTAASANVVLVRSSSPATSKDDEAQHANRRIASADAARSSIRSMSSTVISAPAWVAANEVAREAVLDASIQNNSEPAQGLASGFRGSLRLR